MCVIIKPLIDPKKFLHNNRWSKSSVFNIFCRICITWRKQSRLCISSIYHYTLKRLNIFAQQNPSSWKKHKNFPASFIAFDNSFALSTSFICLQSAIIHAHKYTPTIWASLFHIIAVVYCSNKMTKLTVKISYLNINKEFHISSTFEIDTLFILVTLMFFVCLIKYVYFL